MTSTIKVDTISENTSANGVAVDGVTLKDGGIVATAASTITVADNSDNLSLISTDADANAGPILRLFRNSASPADDDVAGSIVFSGEDDAGNETDYASIKVITEDVTNGTEDGRLSFNIIDSGNAKEVMSIFDNFVGIGTIAPEQLLHVHTNDSGSTYSADGADIFILENNDSLRIDLRTPATSTVGIMFSDTTRNVGSINYSHSNNDMSLKVNSNSNFALRIDPSNILSTNAEDSPDAGIGGITLNQGTNGGNILTFKSTGDVSHPMTSEAENDTYAVFQKQDASLGGLQIIGFSEDDPGLTLQANNATETSTKATTSDGGIILRSSLRDGASVGGHGTNGNLVVVGNHSVLRFIFDAEGDFHADSSSTTFDAYDDAQLVRAYDLSHGRGVINSQFDKYINYKHEDLADAGLVGREDDGTPNHFINVTGFQRLHNGAIWQQYEKHQRLAEAVYEMAKETLGADKADAILKKHDIKLLN